jgi:hypothetical protein
MGGIAEPALQAFILAEAEIAPGGDEVLKACGVQIHAAVQGGGLARGVARRRRAEGRFETGEMTERRAHDLGMARDGCLSRLADEVGADLAGGEIALGQAGGLVAQAHAVVGGDLCLRYREQPGEAQRPGQCNTGDRQDCNLKPQAHAYARRNCRSDCLQPKHAIAPDFAIAISGNRLTISESTGVTCLISTSTIYARDTRVTER